nr:hypothetical protein [Fundicoccus ignavus]
MHSAIVQLTGSIPEHGKEVGCYPDIEAAGFDFYFSDAYSAWQRGINENADGLMCEFSPKKTDLAKVSETE